MIGRWRNSAEAQAERIAARKARGVLSGVRLSGEKAARIRKALAGGADAEYLAQAYEVSAGHVKRIGRGAAWGGA